MSPHIRGIFRPALTAALKPTLSTVLVSLVAATVIVSGGVSSPQTSPSPAPSGQVQEVAGGLRLLASSRTPHHGKKHGKKKHHKRHHAKKHHAKKHHTAHHSPAGSSSQETRALRVAAAQIGDPYVYGASGPNAFDCSGLTSYAYRVADGKHLPHNSGAQQGSTRRVSAAQARPGDLVFFHDGGGVYHVAIYAGNHTIIHAPYPGQRVKRERIWTSAVTYGRVI